MQLQPEVGELTTRKNAPSESSWDCYVYALKQEERKFDILKGPTFWTSSRAWLATTSYETRRSTN